MILMRKYSRAYHCRTFARIPLFIIALLLILPACSDDSDSIQPDGDVTDVNDRDEEGMDGDGNDIELTDDDVEEEDWTEDSDEREFAECIDTSEILHPKPLPWYILPKEETPNPYNANYDDCIQDEYFPTNSEQEGAIRVDPGIEYLNMSLCSKSAKDWYSFDLPEGYFAAFLITLHAGLSTYSSQTRNIVLLSNRYSTQSYQSNWYLYTDERYLFDSGGTKLFKFLPTVMPPIEYYYSFRFDIRAKREVSNSFCNPTILHSNEYIIAKGVEPTDLDVLPECLKDGLQSYSEYSEPRYGIIQFIPTSNSMHTIHMMDTELGAIMVLDHCHSEAKILDCYSNESIGKGSEEFGITLAFDPEKDTDNCYVVAFASEFFYDPPHSDWFKIGLFLSEGGNK